MSIRHSAHAGTFYPGNPQILYEMIVSFFLEADSQVESDKFTIPKMLIAPHAGYVYSGENAACGYKILSKNKDINRIILIGPSHYVAFSGFALCDFVSYASPLGELKIDEELFEYVKSFDKNQFVIENKAHEPEHCLEVQVPFIQVLLKSYSFLPILSGFRTDPIVLADMIFGACNMFEDVGIIISSDLSHFLTYDKAVNNDNDTINKILTGESNGLQGDNACGHIGIAGFIESYKKMDVKPQLVKYSNSGDISGDKSRVVGYASIVA